MSDGRPPRDPQDRPKRPRPRRRSSDRATDGRVARTLVRRAVLYGVVFALLSAAAGVSIEYLRNRRRIEELVERIERVDVLPITESLWTSDVYMLEIHLRGLVRDPLIAAAEISEAGRVIARAGSTDSRTAHPRSFALEYLYDGRRRFLGTMRVSFDVTPLWQRALGTGLLVSIYPIFAILGLGILIYVSFHRIVVRRILEVARYLRSFRADYEPRELRFEYADPERHEPDELDAVRDAIDSLRHALNEQHRQLVDAYALSERLVEEKTHELRLSNQTLERQIHDLERVKAELTAASSAKMMLLGNMSHEIRTPISGIIGLSGLLLTRDLGDSEREYVRAINESGSSLLAIVEDLLDLSRLESDRVEIQYEPVNLRETVSSVVNILSPSAEQQRCTVTIRIDSSLPELFVTDGVRLQQVLRNLLSNAIKFAPDGTVVVSAEPVATDQGAKRLRIAVEDSGIGIREEDLERIFESFFQVDGSYAKEFSGTGLGLAITRRLVDLMGGSIRVTSTFGTGSTFAVELPLVPVEPAPQMHEAAPSSRAAPHPDGEPAEGSGLDPLAGARILLAEDNAINRLYIGRVLEGYGCEVTEAASGTAALEAVEREVPDLVLMDIQMPGLDGVETTRRIRASHDVPIVALTAYARQEELETFLSAGMDAVVTKPVSERELCETMRRLLVRA